MEAKEEAEMTKITKIEKIVREACIKSERKYQYDYHIQIVRKYAKILAKKYRANKKVVDLIALLHDIGRLKYGPKKHAITGAMEAEKILQKFNYDKNLIKEVKMGILSHRHSSSRKAESIEAKIVKDADALSHFDIIPVLFMAAFYHIKMKPERAWDWIYSKIQRDWRTLNLPESRKIARKKYEAANLILKGAMK
jgi:putative nucleotidyltransferase with HDIG domain